jgi:hypothetical protein
MTTPQHNLYEELKHLIEDQNHHNEEQCRDYLQHTKFLLFKEFTRVLNFIHFDSEYRLTSGDADVVISARIREEDGTECKRAYVWECKPAQVAIFKRETDNRFIPTMELVKAENQLLHYYLEAKGSRDFRNTFDITDEKEVCLGGIIISTDKRRIQQSHILPERALILYEKARAARHELYSNSGIRLLTWDRMLEHLRTPRIGGIEVNPTVEVFEPQTIPPGTITTQ